MAIIDEFGLSPIQEGMLFHHLSESTPGIDIEQIVIGYNEPLDAALLERAWQLALDTHPALRTSIAWSQRSRPVQQVHDYVKLHFEVRLGGHQQDLQEFLTQDRARGLDLGRAPLMRLTLFDYGQHRYRLVWTVHHILLDGRAFILVLSGVEETYRKLISGGDLASRSGPAFRPYIEWLHSLGMEGGGQFWADRLQGISGPTPLPFDGNLVGGAFSGSGQEELRLSEETTSALRITTKRLDLTLNTIVMGVWGLLLCRYSGEKDVLFAATKTTRRGSIAGAEDVVGLFLNTIPVRVGLSPGMSFAAALQKLRSEWLSLRAHEHTPLTRIKEVSGFASSDSLFDSLVVFENQGFLSALAETSDCWKTREWCLSEQTGFPLTFAVYGDPAMLLKLEFDRSRFTHETAQRILGHARQLFEAIAVNAEQDIGDLSLLNPAERQQLLEEWNGTEQVYPRHTSLSCLVEAQVERTPDAIALVDGKQQLTFCELNSRANKLARELRKHGAGPGQLVGLFIERSADLVVALLAIVKTGAAYLPLDPLFPTKRISYMLEDSGVEVLVTERLLRGELPAFAGTTILLEDTDWRANGCSNITAEVGPENLAYLIYTSGSTGRPKGVQIPRGALTNFLWSMRQWLQLGEADSVLAVTTISFDIAGLEIWLPLLVGAQVVVASREQAANGDELRALLERHKITFLQATPVTWRLLFESGWRGKPDLQAVCGGEAMPPEVAEQLVPIVKHLWNLYGPTETTIWSTGYKLTNPRGPILIGRPFANTQCYILDGKGHPVPVGVTGELFIAGDGLARGYLNLPELTAEKFIPNPFRSGQARMYRTGDLARYRADGNIECLGRIDHQVKIRGYRIELGEIEAELIDQPEIKQAVLVAREDTPGDKRLVAYLVASDTTVPTTSELRARLKRKLPDYMVPLVYMFLEQLPISPNGKIDRKAMPPPTEGQIVPLNTYVGPRNSTEKKLAAIWAGVLGIPRVGINDDFFEVGGHSLMAVLLIVEVQAAFPMCQSSLSVLLKAPTVEQFARTLNRGQDEWSCLVPIREGGERVPFFCVPGGGGNVLSMRDLAMALPPDQPFYGLQARGLDGQSAPFSSVEETAKCYVDLIRTVQAKGPYHLGGGCYGGLVAFEMARTLRSLGETVGVVALIDTYNYAYGRFISKSRLFYCNSRFFMRRILFHLGRLLRMKPQDWWNYVRGRLRILQRLTKSVIRIAEGGDGSQFPVNLVRDDLETLERSGELGAVLSRVREASLSAGRNFVPKPYDGKLLIFSAKTRDDDPYRDDALGWRPLAVGGVTTCEIEGDHVSIFLRPQVDAIAEKLDSALRQAQEINPKLHSIQKKILHPPEP